MLVFAWCVCVYVQTLYSDDEYDGSAETNDPHGLMLGSSLGEVRTNITVTIAVEWKCFLCYRKSCVLLV
jgi:hypothetical protein